MMVDGLKRIRECSTDRVAAEAANPELLRLIRVAGGLHQLFEKHLTSRQQ
jgi:hypothetical protein